MELEKKFANRLFHKGLISRIYKGQLNSKKKKKRLKIARGPE